MGEKKKQNKSAVVVSIADRKAQMEKRIEKSHLEKILKRAKDLNW